MRPYVSQLVWLALTLSLLGVAAGRTTPEIAQLGLDSTVTLVAYDEGGRLLGSGSGFVVAPGLVLTNEHVIYGASVVTAFRVGASNGARMRAVLLEDVWLDLALLSFAADLGPPLELSYDSPLLIGEPVFAVGSPLGLEGTFTEGILSSHRRVDGVPILQVTAPISPGSSGGPLLNSNGEVVGVIVATMLEGQNINFAIPASVVSEFLGRHRAFSAPGNGGAEDGAVAAVPEPPTPGFDCAYAKTWSELAICGSHALAELDVELNHAFSRVRQRLSGDAFEAVHEKQMAWLQTRDTCELAPERWQEACLEELILERIELLNEL